MRKLSEKRVLAVHKHCEWASLYAYGTYVFWHSPDPEEAYHPVKMIEHLRKAADAAGYDLVKRPEPTSRQEEAS